MSYEYIYGKTTILGRVMLKYIILAIVILLVILVLIFLCKKHANVVFNIGLRTIFGVASICLLNTLIDNIGLTTMVGVNGISIVVVGAFGVPGILLLYGGTYFLKN